MRHFRIDDRHGNSYNAWLRMGSPRQVSREQYATLEQAGKLALLDAPRWIIPHDGVAEIEFELPAHGVSLLRLTCQGESVVEGASR